MEGLHFVFLLLTLFVVEAETGESGKKCSELKMGQYRCLPPTIDKFTQQPEGCGSDNMAPVRCVPIAGLVCNVLENNTYFYVRTPCEYTSGKDFQMALALSIFFGWLGVDRFYLGYPAMGLFKMCTMGFFFVFHLIDILLIALQIVGPADGSAYTMDYYGPRMRRVLFDQHTSLVAT